MKNYYFLDYSESFISNDIIIPEYTPSTWSTHKVPLHRGVCLNGIVYLHNIGLKSPYVNFFVGAPDLTCDIHVDSVKQSYAINYVWGNSTSTMRWFHSDENGESKNTTAGTDYINFNNSKVELIEELIVPCNKLMLVRTDIPHNVTNHSSAPRYCISVRGLPLLNWSDAVDYFHEYFIWQ